MAPQCKPGGVFVARGGFLQHGGFRAFFENDERMAEIDAAWRQARENVQRLLDHHALGNVQKRSAGPAGRMERGEFIGVKIDGLGEQIRLHQLGIFERPANPNCRTIRRESRLRDRVR